MIKIFIFLHIKKQETLGNSQEKRVFNIDKKKILIYEQ